MNRVCLDAETYLFGPGQKLPKMVCLAYREDGAPAKLVGPEEGLDLLEHRWLPGYYEIINQNLPYDLAVAAAERPRLLPIIWEAIREKRARCVLLREKMIANAKGELKFEWDDELGEIKKSLFDQGRLEQKYLGRWRDKRRDSYGKKYAALAATPMSEWPAEALEYPLTDVNGAWDIFHLQERALDGDVIPHEADEVETAFVFQLIGAWGVRTDPEAVEAFITQLDEQYGAALGCAGLLGMLRTVGKKTARWMEVIRDCVRAWHEERGLSVPMTPSSKKFPHGQVSTERDALLAARYKGKHEPDPALVAVANVVRIGKIRSTYAPILRHGTRWPVTPSYNTPIETYRSSCARPNLQNQPRKGGMRDCFVPRVGWWFVFCDYDTLEMRTLAQACLDLPGVGFSDLAVALRLGLDPHVELASVLLDMSSQEAQDRYRDGDPDVENSRQFAKIGNYGLGGGMGPPAFIDYARGYGIDVPVPKAYRIHGAYRERWSEMPFYFQHCSELAGEDGGTVVFPRSGLIRGHVRYTAICNGFFQHPAAMGAKAALRRAARECYLDPSSPLYGCRIWYFGHDEVGMEVPADVRRASAAAGRLRDVMVEEMQPWCPDVPIRASEVACRRWLKGAKAVRQGGLLVPSRQEGKLWVADLPN